ncbi:FAD-dependent oxidoreductase [Lyngbya confervoides]|uniref:FAD-dependent oxidoreductase n=1 Tax=Lyngbya confervoides BDU141951 TaxID=1574623 RepID=A0ABD4T7L6_9CYAN|nr:FAD-dependent oxidoreductase [Lyngbya confervoides]MCM1984536.1 FAD-dependent oxidoreductase [Lyngbya confervoides BDU141951]
MPDAHGLWNEAELLRPLDQQTLSVPVLVVGGSTAAYAATLSALTAHATVCWVMPTPVVGGQYTAQGLPASDDSPLMAPASQLQARYRDPKQLHDGELFCISQAQRAFRHRQRQIQPVQGQALDNPGGGWVSHFAVTPVTAAIALNEAIAPYVQSNQLVLIAEADPIDLLIEQFGTTRRRVRGVVFRSRQTSAEFTVQAEVVIEGTDLGDLLEIGNIESRVGQESRQETQEAVLPEDPRPLCQQAFTFCAVVERSHHRAAIGAPPGYDQSPWLQSSEFTGTFWANGVARPFYHPYGIFRYRRLGRLIPDSQVHVGDVAVLNWGMSPVSAQGPLGCGNDFKDGVLVGQTRQDRGVIWQRGRDRAQAYVHYLQTHDAPDLVGRGDLTWTADGIALEPYIRESRRAIARTTIRHEDVAAKFFPAQARSRIFSDSVGIGHYHYLDFHPNQSPGHVDLGTDGQDCAPFSIPLGALIPIQTEGLILSAKNIGTTHITNAAYRMHPVEWAIGEAGGYLAALLTHSAVGAHEVADSVRLTRQLQGQLTRQGVPIIWFNDVGHDDPDFEAIQVLAAAGIVRTENYGHLNFNPAGTVNRAVVAVALVNILELPLLAPESPSFLDVPTTHYAYKSVETLKAQGIIAGVGNRRYAPDWSITRAHFAILMSKVQAGHLIALFTDTPRDSRVLTRRELSRTLYRLLQIQLNL